MDNKELVIMVAKGGGGGGGAVTSVNGKTGAVALNAEDVGAEPEKFIVTVTESNGTYSANKTVTEIATAYAAGKTPIVMFNGKVFALSLDAVSYTPGFNFTFAEAESNQLGHIQTLTVDDSDLWELYDVYTAPAETVVEVSGSTPTVTPAANTIYKCGTLDSLTISNPPATGAYSIVFTSGSTATAVIIPPKPAMRWQTDDNEPPQGFPAANTRYEINVVDTYVVLGEWPVPEVSE